jgi:hypothetical protein
MRLGQLLEIRDIVEPERDVEGERENESIED